MTLCGIQKKKNIRKISESKYTRTREGVEDTVSPRNYCGKYSALFLVCVPGILTEEKKLGILLKRRIGQRTKGKNEKQMVNEYICLKTHMYRLIPGDR